MLAKKPYSAPQLVQVALNHEQAILSNCSAATNNASTFGTAGPRMCRTAAPACKKRLTISNTNSNSGGRPPGGAGWIRLYRPVRSRQIHGLRPLCRPGRAGAER